MIRKVFASVLVGFLVVAVAQPSSASSTPSKVGVVSFVGGRTQALILSWPSATKAKTYEVFRSTHQDMSGAVRIGTTTSLHYTATGLTRGKTYCFQVRARNGSSVGKRSAHTCKPTIRDEGAARGPIYRVLTYNLCTDKCVNWVSVREAPAGQLIASKNPDIIAAQEANGLATPEGYTLVRSRNAKRLLYRTSRFNVAQTCAETCTDRSGDVEMGYNTYAVWAELIDTTRNDKHVIFVDVHTTTGKDEAAALKRKVEIDVLRRSMIDNNPENLPVVYAGDFNSHKNRPNDYVAGVFHRAGYSDGIAYYDAYDLARTLRRPNVNSYNGFSTTPIMSFTWGDHVDHVWVNPKTTRILRWDTVANFVNGTYATPIPSDHNALSIDVQVN